nr:MAG TPA: hypothetical protein [Caudoviricetes sp.]
MRKRLRRKIFREQVRYIEYLPVPYFFLDNLSMV